MATSQLVVSNEEANGVKLRLLLNKATIILRNVFHEYFPKDPDQLYIALSNKQNIIRRDLNDGLLNRAQFDLLLPAASKLSYSEQYDSTLLTYGLRSLCNIKKPATGWIMLPPSTDGSEGANIVRVRIGRNQMQHRSLKYSNADFDSMWDFLSDALIGLGASQQELDDIKNMILDPDLLQQYQVKEKDLQAALTTIAAMEKALDKFSFHVEAPVSSFVGKVNDYIGNRLFSLRITFFKKKGSFVIFLVDYNFFTREADVCFPNTQYSFL